CAKARRSACRRPSTGPCTRSSSCWRARTAERVAPAQAEALAQDGRRGFPDLADAAERHGHVELGADHLERARDAFLAQRPQAVGIGAADERSLGAEGERLEEILPGADAAVEEHLDPV